MATAILKLSAGYSVNNSELVRLLVSVSQLSVINEMKKTLSRALCLALTAGIAFNPSINAGVVSGRIMANGNGVANIPVSDGYSIVTTDADGRYSIETDKKLGYIFYTLPAGYEPAPGNAPCEPGIWSHLNTAEPAAAETHDFEIFPTENKKFDLVVVTDIHLANRADDIEQFKAGFMPRIKEYVAQSDVPVYTVALGDLSWDRYWYSNDFGPADFMATLREVEYPTLFFPVTGNHDNDPAIPHGPDTDFIASAPFRTTMAPSYYSFNLGDAHIVVLDDIVYKNELNPKRKYAKGIVGDRNYDRYVTDAQLDWLRRDLELVKDKSTPLVICMHIPAWRLSIDGNFTAYPSQGKDGEASIKLAETVKDFEKVRFLTGHTHYNNHVEAPGYPNIHEDNVSALCCIFWNTKAVGGRDICSDGSPAGFKVYSFDGKKFTSRFEGVAECDRKPFRIYDVNTVKNKYATDSTYIKYIEKYPNRTDYSKFDDNMVLVNIFDYEPAGTVTVSEDGRMLEVERITADDPMQIAAYPIELFRSLGKAPTSDAVRVNNHMFIVKARTSHLPVTVTYTDAYGRSTTETLERPGRFDTRM